jgi:hypothetical protein
MFTARFMAGVAYVASPIPRLVPLEVIELLRPAPRQGSTVTVMRIEAVVHMSVKAVWAMKPGPSAKEHSAHKPIRPVVAVGGAVIGCVVEVPIRASRLRPNPNADRNLGGRG